MSFFFKKISPNIFRTSLYLPKVCGYADDIVFIIKECSRSIKKLFQTYHSFSKISGIELNTEKTEILRIGDKHIEKEYIPGTPVFTHYTSARRRYTPHGMVLME